ncbi:hypothetical protein ScPMuIL_013460 [Solemya velum]
MIDKSLLTILISVVAVLFVVVSEHQSLGDDPTVDCTQYTNATECCTEACQFVICTDESKNETTKCVNATDKVTDVCETNSTGTQNCTGPSAPSTTVAPTTHNDTNTTTAAPTTLPPQNDTTPAPGNGTSPAPGNTTTVKPTTQPSKGDADSGQHFDTASFIGGIVLCLGIVAIVFLAVKYYQTKQRNYHTL